MDVTTSVSEFRQNIGSYLESVSKGTKVIIKDEKRNKQIAQLVRVSTFDGDLYEKILRKAAGVFTGANHPEWSSKDKIKRWLRKSRSRDERKLE